MNPQPTQIGRTLSALLVSFSIHTASAAVQRAEGRQVISDPAIQRAEGQRIAAEVRALVPKASSTNTATLRIFGPNRKLRAEVPLTIRTTPADDQWQIDYISREGLSFRVTRSHNAPNRYAVGREIGTLQPVSNLLVPFAGSDFWLVDLGLDFFHWPEQRLLSKEQRRGEACFVIESTAAKPPPGGYSRLVTWLDQGTLGIVAAEAYDTRGKLMKEFQPKSFKKVNGQWQLKEVEIRNEQTDSRTSLVFDVEVQ